MNKPAVTIVYLKYYTYKALFINNESLSLHSVQRESKKNRMDSKNLAVVFAPSLMRPPANADQLSAMMKLPEQKKITELLISHYDVLFPVLY